MSGRFVVVGAGTMGVGIAYVAANAGYDVELVEVAADRAAAARTTLDRLWRGAVEAGRLEAGAAGAAAARVTLAGDLAGLKPEPEVLVEAVPERVELKRSVLAAGRVLRPGLLASNTSSIPIGTLGDGVLGLHFFNPVWAMPLLEIVVPDGTPAADVAAARAVAVRLGKKPVVVRDLPGFATSRLGVALGLEAIRMLADGVASAADIDTAMTLGYRHPVGPLELTDMVGLDVRLDIARTLQAAYGDRFAPPPLLLELVAAGRLGRKSGEGFYRWQDGKRVGGGPLNDGGAPGDGRAQ